MLGKIRDAHANGRVLDAARLRLLERETFQERAAEWRRRAAALLAEAEAAETRGHRGIAAGYLQQAVSADAMARRLADCAE